MRKKSFARWYTTIRLLSSGSAHVGRDGPKKTASSRQQQFVWPKAPATQPELLRCVVEAKQTDGLAILGVRRLDAALDWSSLQRSKPASSRPLQDLNHSLRYVGLPARFDAFPSNRNFL